MSEVVQNYTPGTHPDMPPPAGQRGILLWLRKNLFSSWANSLATLLAIYILYKLIPPLMNWAVLDAVLNAGNRDECKAIGQGACWAFIKDRFNILVYGFYPEPLRWRVNMSFILLCLALVPVLFDNIPFRKPGLIFSVAYPFIAGWLLLGGMGMEPVGTDEFGGMMLNTVVGVTGIAFSLPLGILLALGRQSHLPIVKSISVCFIEFIRGVPLITLLFVASTMLNYFLPPGTTFDLLLRVLIMVTLFSSAYIAEVVRGGLQAIPNGQYEAANSMGLKYWQSMRLIILPQALKISIPGIVNTFIGLFKDTTLVLIIGLLDVLGISRASLADAQWNGLSNEAYISIALFFFAACFGMSRYSIYLESKLDKGYKR
jgi:general L-amino acid transport system permease protein